MRAKVKNKAYAIHFAESRFNGKKGKVVQVSSHEPEICVLFKSGESAWFRKKDLK